VLRSFLKRFRKVGPLRIGLCAERLYLSDGRSEGREIEIQGPESGPPEGAAGAWQAAVDRLPEVLAPFEGRQASVVVADQFVSYALLPWSDTLKTHAQWLALARHRFCAIHGPVAAEWEIRFAETAPAGPRLACAAERGLIDALAEKFAASRTELVSVQPFLVAAFNRVRSLTGGSCWLLVEEPGRLTLALIQRGLWIAIRSRRMDEHWRRVLPQIIERESAFLGLEEPCTRVIVFAQGSFDADEHEAFRTEALSYRELTLEAA
jgi:hypothetical protein